MVRISTGLVAILLSIGSGSSCSAASPKIAADFSPDSLQPIDVIVQFATPLSSEKHNRVSQHGGKLKAEIPSIKAGVYSISPAAAKDLADDPDVVYVSPDRQVQATLDTSNPAVGATTAFTSGLDGTGVGIAIIDSGILEVRDLMGSGTNASNTSRVIYSQSFVAGSTSTADQYGHGTHVAGVAAGNANASTGTGFTKSFRGIAPNARLINLRVLDANGIGTESAVIQAIDKAIQLKNQYNIRVMNLSLGRPVFESYVVDPLCQAVERAWNAGIVVVVAAGNEGRNRSQGTDGYGTITSPGNDPRVITVGAMKTIDTASRADDLIASYSSKGPTLFDHIVKPDLVAPGNRIVSLVASKSLVSNNSNTNRILCSYYQTTSSKSYSGDYYRLSGTSMSAPMVAGAAAVMLQKDWTLSPDTIKARLMRTASKSFPAFSTATDPLTGTKYTSQYDIFTVGAGYLDLRAALNDVQVVDPGATAASPVAVLDSISNTVRVVNANPAMWGKSAIWGSSAVWGSAAIWGTNIWLDGQAAIWGSSAVWGSSAIWGSTTTKAGSAIWGTGAIWGTSTQSVTEALNQLLNGE